MTVVRYFVSAGSVFAALWLALSVIINFGVNFASGGILNTNSLTDSFIYGSDGYSAITYGRLPLARRAPQLILIGASNIREGFDPKRLSEQLDGITTHNMAASSGTPRLFRETAQLDYNVIPKKFWNKTTFITGVTYMTFEDQPLTLGGSWGGAAEAFKNEASRYGLYRFTDGVYGIEPKLTGFIVKPVLYLLKPSLLFNRLWRNQTIASSEWSYARSIFLRQPIKHLVDRFRRNDASESDAQKAKAIRTAIAHGYDTKKSFEELVGLAAMIKKHGGKFIVVDLPLPKWHSSAVPAFTDYQKRKMKWFRLLETKYNVSIINMQDGFADNTFFDHVHPKPNEVPVWTKYLADKVRPIIASEKTLSEAVK